jgi:hypothetical protein
MTAMTHSRQPTEAIFSYFSGSLRRSLPWPGIFLQVKVGPRRGSDRVDVSWHQRVNGRNFRCHLASTHREFRRLIFFEMRNAAAPAFERAYVGQCAETLRSSNQSHVLRATWAQRQLRPRAFRIHDKAQFFRGHAWLYWLDFASPNIHSPKIHDPNLR